MLSLCTTLSILRFPHIYLYLVNLYYLVGGLPISITPASLSQVLGSACLCKTIIFTALYYPMRKQARRLLAVVLPIRSSSASAKVVDSATSTKIHFSMLALQWKSGRVTQRSVWSI